MLSCRTIYAVSSVQKYSYHVQLKEKAKSAFLLIMKKNLERIMEIFDLLKKKE